MSKISVEDENLEHYQKVLRKAKRKTHPFILIYMIFKGLFILMIFMQLSTKPTVFKFVMMATYIFNIKSIIAEVCQICSQFQFWPLLELRLRYFYLTFLTSKKWRLPEEFHIRFIQLYNEKLEKIDLTQNKAYYECFLKRMEEKLLEINRIYWGMNTFSLLGLLSLLLIWNYLHPDSAFIKTYHLDWLLGLEAKVWSNWALFSIELFQIHGVLVTLYLEYMLLSFYLDCSNNLADLDQASTKELLKVIYIKLKCMVDLRENNIKRTQVEDMFTKYSAALNWDPAARDRKLEASSLTASKRMSATAARQSVAKSSLVPDLTPIAERRDSISLDGTSEHSQEAAEDVAKQVSSEELQSSEDSSSYEEKLQGFDQPANRAGDIRQSLLIKQNTEDEEDYGKQIKNQEKKETYQNSLLRKNTSDGSNIVGLNKLISNTLTNSSKDNKVNYMTELTTKEEMLILMFKNRYKYLYCKTLTGSLFFISRLMWIPLFYPLISSLNFITIGFFIWFMIRAKQRAKLFIEEANQYSKLVLIFVVSLWVQAFIHQQLYEVEEGFYKKFIDSSFIAPLKFFLLPLEKEIFRVCFYWFFIVCVSIALLPYFIWLTTLVLFRQTIHKTETYHYYLLDNFRKRNLVIDYIRWKESTWRFINYYYKTAFTSPVEIYAMFSMFCYMVFWRNLFLPLLILTMGLVLTEHFRGDQVDNDATRLFTLLRQKRNLEWYRTVFWVSLYTRPAAEFFGKLGFFKHYSENETAFMQNFEGTGLVLILLIISYLLSDLLETEDYLNESYKIKGYRQLKVGMASLCKAYELNEHKLYNRMVAMMRKGHLDEIASNIIDLKQTLDCQAFLEEPDIMKNLLHSFDKITQQHLGTWKAAKLKFVDNVHSLLMTRFEKYIRQDMMILFESFRVRNNKLIKAEDINLEDYFEDNMNFYFKLYEKVDKFYNLLSYEKEEELAKFNDAINKFQSIGFVTSKKKWAEPVIERLSLQPSEAKKHHHLANAAEILFKAVSSTTQYASSTNVDSYKVEFKKKGYLPCFFGKTKVILFNLKTTDSFYESSSFYELSIWTIITVAGKILIDRFDKLAVFVIVGINIIEGGFTNIAIIGLLIFTIFVEESPGKNTPWILALMNLTLRMVGKRLYPLFCSQLTAEFFLGNLESNNDLFCLILVIFTIQNLKYYSPNNKSSTDIENPGQAIVRMTVNDDFKQMVGRLTFPIMRKKESLNRYLLKLDLTEIDGISASDFKIILVKQLIKNKLMLKEFKANIMLHCQKLMRVLRYDFLKITKDRMESFFFRNFSYHMRKVGASYLGEVSFLFLLINLYILLFFPTLGSLQAGVASFVFENRVTAFTVLNFTIYLSFFILHFLLDSIKTKDLAGLRDKAYKVKLIKGKLDHISYEQAVKKPIAKFKNNVKILQKILKLMNPGQKEFNIWKESPHFYLYLCNIVMWVYLNVSVFFWHSYHGNARAGNKSGFSMFVCEPKDNIREPGESNLQLCRNYRDRVESQIFYLLNTVYIVVCMYQIRDGQQILVSKVRDFTSSVKSILFSLFQAVPLLREAEVTFKFCATQTSLVFTDFVLINEIETIMQNAKRLHLARTETKTGKTLSRSRQICLGLTIVSIVIGVLCLPLYIFYVDQSQSYFPIESANFTIDLTYQKTNTMLSLISMTRVYENRGINELLDYSTVEILKKTGMTRMYPLEQIKVTSRNQKISFLKASDNKISATPNLIQDMINLIDNSNQVYLRMKMSFTTQDKVPESKTKERYFLLESVNKNSFLATLRSGCLSERYSALNGAMNTKARTEFFLWGQTSVLCVHPGPKT
jgi:hypothetical protein